MANPLSLEHKVVKQLKSLGFSSETWLLAVSGGVDSMAMVEILWRWQRHLKVRLVVGHVHHGPSTSTRVERFRSKSRKWVEQWCAQHRVPFLFAEVSTPLHSEDEFRQERQKAFKGWMMSQQVQADRLLTAHHQDDLLETRVLRLLRGTGRQGLMAMRYQAGHVIRPFLEISKREIVEYAESRRLKWVHDPSNSREEMALRNWVRLNWLPELENRSPGASKALARSLAVMADEHSPLEMGPCLSLRRTELMQNDTLSRQRIVARFLRALGLSGYTRSHVQEILKRLETRQKAVEFQVLGLSIQANEDFIWASRV